MKEAENAIANLEDYLNVPLWCVYGSKAFPSILCFRLRESEGKVIIWGYSTYKNQPAFRTLGTYLNIWVSNKENPVFFSNQDDALNYLRAIITPKKSAF